MRLFAAHLRAGALELLRLPSFSVSPMVRERLPLGRERWRCTLHTLAKLGAGLTS